MCWSSSHLTLESGIPPPPLPIFIPSKSFLIQSRLPADIRYDYLFFLGLEDMTRIKSPGLLIRISHLILIQIVFIFSALALVLFYPSAQNSVSENYSRQGHKILDATSILANMIKSDSGGVYVDSQVILEAERCLRADISLSRVDLICRDSKSGNDSLIHLAHQEGITETPHVINSIGNPNHDLFRTSSGPIVSVLSPDGEYLEYYVKPEGTKSDYIILVTSHNTLSGTLRNNQAEFIFLLFLFSALISLLIINLIFKGIKRPLSHLLQAFEKTASGVEDYLVEEEGDKDIRALAVAFNKMSHSLTEKQRKLSFANKETLKSNRALAESESILTALVDYSPDAVIVSDLEDQVIIYNQQTARDFGYNQTDMLGKKISNLFTIPVSLRKSAATAVETAEGQEVICRRRDGGRFPALLVHTELGPDGNKPIAMLYFVKNISESRNYQNMILKLDRIASRGKMARDIAHEINNYLAVIQGNLELLPIILEKNDLEKALKKVTVMRETVGKISKFTDGLTQFSDENSEFRKEDLNQLIENLVAFLKPQNRFDEILIGTNLAENLPLVEIDASQIQLLLVNLIYNSAESLAGFTGTRWIIISTSFEESSNQVYLKVSDSGPGVSQDDIPKLFATRFSTRRNGNGLGLITCKNVVDTHRGEISYHTGDESKAIFVTRFPASRESKEAGQEPAESEKSPAHI